MARETQVFHVAFTWTLPRECHNLEAAELCRPYLESEFLTGYCDKFIYQLEDSSVGIVAIDCAAGGPLPATNYHFQGYGHLRDIVGKKRPTNLGQLIQTKLGVGLFHLRPASAAGVEALKSYCLKSDTRLKGPWADGKHFTGAGLISESSLYPFQNSILAALRRTPDDRSLHWVYDPRGNTGKTAFLKLLAYKKLAFPLQYGKASDLNNLVFNNPNEAAYIFDLTRSKPADFASGDIYSVMEGCKNGMVINLKYKTGLTLMNPPHVWIFANVMPELPALSRDRWHLYTIDVDSKELISL